MMDLNSITQKNIKVLIIDDDDVIRLTMQNILKKKGYNVIAAENGNSGLELFKKEKPDIVITDILMPDKEGLETISEMRALKPDAKIIAISGGGSTQNMSFLQLAQRVGANRLLVKPIKPDQLLAAVETPF